MNKKKTTNNNNSSNEIYEGVIIRSTGSHYRVRELKHQNIVECIIRGKFRLKGLKTTNPLAVGDKVRFIIEKTNDQSTDDSPPISPLDSTGVIIELLPRENYILRKATNLSKQQQILCANIDQAIIVATIAQPDISLGFLDRFLVMASAFHIPCVLIFNKVDILTSEQEKYLLKTYTQIYQSIPYPVLVGSALDPLFGNSLHQLFKDKISFMYGRSGVGKSTIINTLAPDLDIKTGAVSESSFRGKHTTTFAEMHPIDAGGYIIDAPGLREFEPTDVAPVEIAHYMPDFLPYIDKCKYNDCKHYEEPQCAIKEAVNNGHISPFRYDSYLMMLLHIEK